MPDDASLPPSIPVRHPDGRIEHVPVVAAGAIPPALTPAEWARVRAGRAIDPPLQDEVDPLDVSADGRPVGAIMGALRHIAAMQYRPSALMALANAALPDADPRKITRADIDAIRWYAEMAEHVAERLPQAGYDAIADAYERALAKLAALLPPA